MRPRHARFQRFVNSTVCFVGCFVSGAVGEVVRVSQNSVPVSNRSNLSKFLTRFSRLDLRQILQAVLKTLSTSFNFILYHPFWELIVVIDASDWYYYRCQQWLKCSAGPGPLLAPPAQRVRAGRRQTDGPKRNSKNKSCKYLLHLFKKFRPLSRCSSNQIYHD